MKSVIWTHKKITQRKSGYIEQKLSYCCKVDEL